MTVWILWWNLCTNGVCTWVANSDVYANLETCDAALLSYYPVKPRWFSGAGTERKERRCVAVKAPQ